ncbi:aldo/keto reductase [Chloroflexota bacterium]
MLLIPASNMIVIACVAGLKKEAMMDYRQLGNSGLKVSAIGLGGNNFGWWADEQTSIAVVNQALDQGINFIDTADMYDRGRSEEFIGKALKGKRDKAIIATKFGYPMSDDPNDSGASRHHIMNAVENSLRRLQTDYIDHYQVHNPDPATPIEETIRALDDLVRAGKVRYIGCSNFAAWQLNEALWTSKTNGLETFVSIQSRYNIMERQLENEVVPCCQANGIGIVPWGPLAGGFLTGKYSRENRSAVDGRLSGTNRLYENVITKDNWNKLAKLQAFAAERNHKMGELALTWLLSKPWVSTVIAGARTAEQISGNVAAAEWKLTPDDIKEVEAIL